MITSKIFRFRTEHIKLKDSPDSKLQTQSICFVGILSILEVIGFSENLKMFNPDMANNCVLLVDHSGVIKHIAGEGYGQSHSQFTQPAGLTVDSQGNFIIAGTIPFVQIFLRSQNN